MTRHVLSLTLVATALSCGRDAVKPESDAAPAPTPAPAPAAADPDADPSGGLVPAKVDPKSLPAIYDVDSAAKDLWEAALSRAQKENKKLLVTIGGNWCSWCHKLHMLMAKHTAIRDRLDRSYVELKLDSNAHEDFIKQLEVEPKGVPFLLVVDGGGKILVRQETGSLEIGPRHDPAKILAFLDDNAGA